MKVHIKRTLGGSVALVVAALALAACGGSGDDGGSGSTGTDSMSSYQKCLSDNGVTLPSGGTRPSGRNFPSGMPSGMPTNRPTVRPSGTAFPGGGQGFPGGGNGGFVPEGVDPTKWAQAQEKCSSLRPTGQGGFGNGQGGPGGGQGRNAAYRNCMSEHGVTIQDGQALNTADAKVVAAEKACAVLKPSASPTN
ncbi:hypothetical protein HDA40_004443 [Hamadaea flava]|uniref:PT repeat-containing protein n=1 Tax=Hamadaea flava TaxID=1742688 RepID=A0ABV8LFD9_9ACTN|nr:hypothetical protein [Hamadaea flava]MCP2325936.1 hypothetical protein [Hamadaea flava]